MCVFSRLVQVCAHECVWLWLASSPLENTVVLGVTSRSRDGLKGKAHSCDSLVRSIRSSMRSRRGWTDLGSPMFNTQTWVQAQPRLSSVR